MITQNGNIINFGPNTYKSIEALPAKNLLVQRDPQTGEYYLEIMEDFTLPKKIYGEVESTVKRYLDTFNSKPKNLGILLRGLKGTGKSLLAKKLCIESELPVLMITQPYSGTGFETFLSNIKQECIVFMDEFEKTYKGEDTYGLSSGDQAKMLTILDGVFESKKLFLLTANNSMKINDALINRPGRIHYLKDYGSLSWEVMNEVIDDLLTNKDEKEGLLNILSIISEVNMDCLTTLIWEMNKYGESAKEAISHLNIRPEDGDYEIEWIEKDVKAENNKGKEMVFPEVKYHAVFNKNPLLHDMVKAHAQVLERSEAMKNFYIPDKYLNIKMELAKVTARNGSISIKYKDKEYLATKKRKYSSYIF